MLTCDAELVISRVYMIWLLNPSDKTRSTWLKNNNWLRFTEERKLICEVCCWHAETSGLLSNPKFVSGSTNYQLLTLTGYLTLAI